MKIRVFIFAALLCMSTGFTAYANDTCMDNCQDKCIDNCQDNCDD